MCQKIAGESGLKVDTEQNVTMVCLSVKCWCTANNLSLKSLNRAAVCLQFGLSFWLFWVGDGVVVVMCDALALGLIPP